ncbi:MAG: branched-chain amino acid ABC transporter permease [Chloroflexi bacterium]|nr:branched-chain amino acid ABC transporter permease [Chloroflexota bacterium]
MMKQWARSNRAAWLLPTLIVFVLAIAPGWLGDYAKHIVIVSLYYIIMAASWNLLAGYTGQFSLSHQTFAALGGYASGLLIYYFKVPLAVGFVAAVLTTLLTGYFLGRLVLKMRGIYLAVATWAFSESFRLIISALYTYTRGDQGLPVPPLFETLNPINYYYLFLGLTVVLLFAMYVVLKSPIGSFLRAIKDDELAAAAMGVDTVKWKLFVMTFASTIAGIAGFFYAHYIVILSPVMLSFNEIGKIVIMVVFGGLGTFIGPLIGAPVIVILSELMRDFAEWNMVFYSLCVIVIMRTYREGLTSLLRRLVSRWINRRRVASDT